MTMIWLVIIGLAIYWFVFRKKSVSHRQENVIDIEAEVVEETEPCPMCGSKVKDDFIVCPYCGFTLRPKCESCGRELNRDWQKCPYCETPVKTK